MFFGVMLGIWAALHVYLFWRAASVPFIKRHVPWGVLAALAVFLWAVFPLSHSLEDSGVGSVARILVYVGATWVGVLFLLVVAMLAADLVTAFGLIFRKAAPALRGWALVAGGALAVFALVQGSRAPVMRNYDVQIANWPHERNGAVVVVASDLHLGSLLGADWLAARVDQINAQRPDLIVLAGDIVEGHGESSREFLPLLRKLSAPWGVWAVNGNHDGYGRADDSSDQRAGLLEGAGIHVLRDQWAQVQPGILLAGVDDLTSRERHGQPLAGVVEGALAGRPAGATIFVSHTPWLAESVANHGAALMLSAHTHGGQIWPFNYYVQLSYPLMGGRYEIKGMPVIVCRGTGTWGPRMRLWHPSEILRVTLLSPATSAHRH